MKSDEAKKIVILSYYHFPCSHPVLENVFAKELGSDHDIIWLFQGDTSNGNKLKWHNSEVLLTKSLQGNSMITVAVNRVLAFNKLFQLIWLLQKNQIKIVLIRDLPVVSFFISFLKLVYGFKLYYQHSAPLSDMDIAYFKLMRGLKRFYYLIRGLINGFLLKKVLKKADIVFPISNFHKKKLLALSSKNNFVPLTMGVDSDWLKMKKEVIPYLERIKQKGFLITYFGTLSITRNPKFILKVFAEVKKRCSNCTLLMMGKATTKGEGNELRHACRDLKIQQNVIFTGQLDRNSLKDHLDYCDISISAIPVEDFYKNSSPTKIYESLGNGVPVVANRGIHEQEKVIRESGSGILVDYEVKSFSDGIVNLLNNLGLRNEMAEKGRNYVNKNYTYKVVAESIAPYF